MQRRNVVAAVLVLVVVILAGSWFGFSGREGLTPVGPESPQASAINDLYLFIGIFAALIFLSVTIPLALIIARYRERGLPREVEGPQVRGNTRLELAWTLASFAIVIVLVVVSLVIGADVNNPEARAAAGGGAGGTGPNIRVEGRRFYWRYVYENGAIAIDRLRLPVGRTADLAITAPDNDVQHSWWAPALQGKMDAIPGVVNHLQITPRTVGVFDGRCGELCGIQHAVMNLAVEVMPADEFDAWLAARAADEGEGGEGEGEGEGDGEESGENELGRALFEGVCSKCHFAAPEYAPNILGNPILGDREQLRQVVENGIEQMPAVGRGWTDREHDALADYVRQFAPADESGGSEDRDADSEDDGS